MDPNVVALFAFCASALGDALVVGAARGVFVRAAEALPDGGRALRRLKGLAGDEKSRFCNGIEKELLEIARKAFSGFEGIRVDRRALRRAKRQITHIIKRAKPKDYAALTKARTPEAIEQVLRRLPRKWGRGIREADRQWFDELVGAVAREYTILAPWSPTFQVRALDAILDKLEAIRHDVSAGLENDRVTHSELSTIRSEVSGLRDDLSAVLTGPRRPGRLLFGGRPDKNLETGNDPDAVIDLIPNTAIQGIQLDLKLTIAPTVSTIVIDHRITPPKIYISRIQQEQVHECIINNGSARVALLGTPGSGKSIIACELADWCQDKRWTLIAWIDASSHESTIHGLIELAKRFGINDNDIVEATTTTAPDKTLSDRNRILAHRCMDHIASAAPTNRLIIFDNVNSINDLTGYIPHGKNLRILATSWNREGWNMQGWTCIDIGTLSREQSIDLLQTKTGKDDTTAANDIASILCDLPLAIAQAAAYIEYGNYTLEEYRALLVDHKITELTRPEPGSYYEVPVSEALLAPVNNVLQSLNNNARSALMQLKIMAPVAEAGVATRWLIGHIGADSVSARHTWATLINRHVCLYDETTELTRMHALQARILRESWKTLEVETTFNAFEHCTVWQHDKAVSDLGERSGQFEAYFILVSNRERFHEHTLNTDSAFLTQLSKHEENTP